MNGSLGITGKLSNLALRAVRRGRGPLDMDLDSASREEDPTQGFDDLTQAERRALRLIGGSAARQLAATLREARENADTSARNHREELARIVGRLTARLAARGLRLAKNSSRDAGREPRATILLVDDQPAMLRVFEKYVETMDCKSISCAGLDEVEDVLARGIIPDLVVTDLVLDGATGVAVKNLIAEKLPQTPVMFVTGYDNIGTKDDAILPKTCSPERFATVARYLMQKRQSVLGNQQSAEKRERK